MKNKITNTIFFLMTGMFIFTFFSCYSEDDLRRRYNQGYSEGNRAGHNKGYTEGYNEAKKEYQKQISELQNDKVIMERNQQNRIATIERNHRAELTVSYNRGFQAGEIAMEEKYWLK